MHVVVVGLYLDSAGRHPREVLASWRDFGRVPAAAVLARPGLRVTLVFAGWDDYRADVLGMPCYFVREEQPVISLPGGRAVRRLPTRLYGKVASLGPDLLHVEGLVLPRLVRGLARAIPVPLVVQDHGTKPRPGWRGLAGKWGFRSVTGAMFTARGQAEPFRRAGILRSTLPIFEVLEGSSDFTPADRAASRAATGITGDPALLWLGQLDENKDPMMVLQAVSSASSRLGSLTLYMCYRRAPLLEQVRQRVAADPALSSRVRLVGEIPFPGTEPWIRSADFVVQGSHAEGSGFAAIEAFACGTTPLMTDIPSLRRICGEGKFGALVPVGGAAALSNAIVEWSGRDREVLRREARQHFERVLSFEAAGRELSAAWEAVRRIPARNQ